MHRAVAVLAGMFWWQLGAGTLDANKVRDLGGLLFFQVLFMSFSSMFQVRGGLDHQLIMYV